MTYAAYSPQGPSDHDVWMALGTDTASREVRIARAILSIAQAEARRLGNAKLLRVGVNVGADCDIDLEALENGLRGIRHDRDLEGVVIHLSLSPRVYGCCNCGHEYVSGRNLERCVQCSAPDCELLSGDELELSFIEVVRP
jgi:Zn finger protein HypA/HybF involved in hydrogenase expression